MVIQYKIGRKPINITSFGRHLRMMTLIEEKFEDTKEVIRSHISKKDRQYNG